MSENLNPSPNGISTKDIKILWGRAAEKCAICRKDLTDDIEIDSVTTGHMCHIVGEKNSEKSPRGISNLDDKERNSYPNLILLCRNHHADIDLDTKKYSIEKLHDIKSKHELWVKESLVTQELPHDVYYGHLIDFLNQHLQLELWGWFSENAIKQLVHDDFIGAMDAINGKKISIIWPEKDTKLEESIANLMDSFVEYMSQYLEYAQRRGVSEMFGPAKTYKEMKDPFNRNYYSEVENIWARKNYILLCKYTVYLNEFIQHVRNAYNPFFYLTRGKFILNDSLGTHNFEPAYVSPTLEMVNKRFAEILSEENDLNKRKP